MLSGCWQVKVDKSRIKEAYLAVGMLETAQITLGRQFSSSGKRSVRVERRGAAHAN